MHDIPFGQRFKDSPVFNIGSVLDIPTGKFCGNEILNGGAVLPGQFGTGYPRNSGHSFHVFNLINESLRKTAPETTERYRLAAMLFQVMGLGVTWEDESIAPTVSWFDLEGNMDFMPDLIKDILTKDYSEELRKSKSLTEPMVKGFSDTVKSMSQSGRNETIAYMDSFSHLSDK